jgi:hypothetical protein
MTFSIGTITRCAGQAHWRIPITINSVTRTLETSVSELQDAAPEGHEEARAAIVSRIRSALLEANAANFAQSRTALEGKSFEV